MLDHAASSKGFLIDGYPREVQQGIEFENMVNLLPLRLVTLLLWKCTYFLLSCFREIVVLLVIMNQRTCNTDEFSETFLCLMLRRFMLSIIMSASSKIGTQFSRLIPSKNTLSLNVAHRMQQLKCLCFWHAGNQRRQRLCPSHLRSFITLSFRAYMI